MIIKHATIIDCTGRIPYKADVRVENGIITEIGKELDGEQYCEAEGCYLLPGLVNLHAHINRRNLSRKTGAFRQGAPEIENGHDMHRILYAAKNAWYELKTGVTTIRDLCSVGRTASFLKQAIQDGIIRGPRMYVCGLGIASTGGHETHRYKGAVEVDGVDAVLQATRHEIKLGADFIKVMSSGGIGGMPEHEHPGWAEFSTDEIQAACFAAHSHNKGVTVHAMGELPVMNALHAGVDGIEHGAVLTEEALNIMQERGVYYVPTASGITAVADREANNGNASLASLVRELVVEPQRESIKKAHQRGILIGAGTDTLGTMLDELLIFKNCGMSEYEAIQTATINAAKILRNEKHFGTIECGKHADLLLLRANPLENLEHITQVEKVFLAGEEISEKWMCNLQ